MREEGNAAYGVLGMTAEKKAKISSFRRIVWNYYRTHGRDLPWRRTKNPYAIAVSEIMLQQTQVDRVQGKYEEFLIKFPAFIALAQANSREVLRAWQGLGYNRRAIALLKLARTVVREYNGKLPRAPAELEKLPGVGPATAGSIAAFAYRAPIAFIETNIRRAILHHFFPRRRSVSEKEIYAVAAAALDKRNPREWYWALMDYGAMLGKTAVNPNRRSAYYRKQSAFRGSDRELRGKILRVLLKKSCVTVNALLSIMEKSEEKLREVLNALEQEGFLKQRGEIVMIAE